MGTTKSDQFTKEQNQVASLVKAIGHPARIAILEHLIRLDSCYCGDIVEEIGLAQSTISQHLKALKEVDLIQGNTSGAKVCYCINKEKINELSDTLSRLFKMEIGSNCC